MNDAVALLREKMIKAEAKLARAEKSLESARTELSDLQTALRVMEGLLGESGAPASMLTGVPVRQTHILTLLGVGLENAKPPAELFEDYNLIAHEEISLETFRTTIWRMADKTFDVPSGKLVVRRNDNGYWKEAVRVGNVPNPPAPPIPPPPPIPKAPPIISTWEPDSDDDEPDWGRPSGRSSSSFSDDLDDDIAFLSGELRN